ncbi:MAG: XdhC family protein [Pseudomonadota bacterium]
MTNVWQAAVEEIDSGRPFALATIIGVRGSSPRHVGTRFLVRKDGTIVGTIGGGLLEADVQRLALQSVQTGTSSRAAFSFRGSDPAGGDMVCGGDAEVLIEYVAPGDEERERVFRRVHQVSAERRTGYLLSKPDMPVGGHGTVQHMFIGENNERLGGFPGMEAAVRAVPSRRLLKSAQLLTGEGLEHQVFLEWLHPLGTVYIFGAGHVGECVAHLAAYAHFKVVIMDDREEFASRKKYPEADEVVVLDSFDDSFSRLDVDEDGYLVIVTRGHAHDKTVLAQALRSRAGYIGMIGSRRKTALIFDTLMAEGFPEDAVRRVHSPIGVPIGGETPQEIAVSIVAEMIKERSGKEKLRSGICMG